ncbi:uncharacterized protein LOC113388366 [Ctenocephalides felis]|uniref:uncharacterized protein LOC113388366 n=1 Tax=Ctenocephalides felis TaxID=7515 RepID=UPI000E6E1FB3|nr:uncharacterized protein LOC113388366 [Ctenocephalides felis]
MNSAKIVYFNVDTPDLHDYEILKIAAKFDEKDEEFKKYITPTKNINPVASDVNGLTIREGILHLDNEPVPTCGLKEALSYFKQFLEENSNGCCVLVAHCVSFHSDRLVKAILDCDMIQNFGIIGGFCDSLELFKKRYPERKSEFTLYTLEEDFLDTKDHPKSKNEVLKQLSNKLRIIDDILEMQKMADELILLAPLKSVVTIETLRKMSKKGLTYEILKKAYEGKGEEGLEQILKTKVTKAKLTINNVAVFFQKHANDV